MVASGSACDVATYRSAPPLGLRGTKTAREGIWRPDYWSGFGGSIHTASPMFKYASTPHEEWT